MSDTRINFSMLSDKSIQDMEFLEAFDQLKKWKYEELDVFIASVDLVAMKSRFISAEIEAYSEYQLETIIDQAIEAEKLTQLIEQLDDLLPFLLKKIPHKRNDVFEHLIEEEYFCDLGELTTLITYFPEKKDEIFAAFIADPDILFELCDKFANFTKLTELFSDKKNQLFLEFLENKPLVSDFVERFTLENFLMTFNQIFPDIFPKHAHEIIATYARYHNEEWNVLNPLPFVIKQVGPNCHYYALSAITEYFADKLFESTFTKPTLFYPAKLCDFPDHIGYSLKKLGKKIGLATLGGIFDLNESQQLIKQIDLDSEIISIHSAEHLQKIIKLAIKNKIPLLFPYDLYENRNGSTAHYAIIIGYKIDLAGDEKFFISQDGCYELKTAEELFNRNDSLNFWPSTAFIKQKKKGAYARKPDNFQGPIYKTIHEPDHDLSNTLKHKLQLVFPKEWRSRLEANFEFDAKSHLSSSTNLTG